MKKKNNIIVYALLVAGLIVSALSMSCLSITMPEPSSDKDTLVVVPMLRLNTRVGVFDGEVGYQINMENIETGKIVSFKVGVRTGYGYKYIRGIPPGMYSIKEYVPHGLVGLGNQQLRVRNYLVVREGEIAIFPVKVVIMIFTNFRYGQESPSFYAEFPEIDDQQRERILTLLSVEKSYQFWHK